MQTTMVDREDGGGRAGRREGKKKDALTLTLVDQGSQAEARQVHLDLRKVILSSLKATWASVAICSSQ